MLEVGLMSAYVSGLELSRLYYGEAVRPLLDAAFPGLPHSAALIGRGSEVLGFDDEMSTDHDWKARVLLFLAEDDERVGEVLRRDLPSTYRGHPADFGIHTIRAYFQKQLDFDLAGEIEVRDWLTFTEQNLRTITAGGVHHDDLGLQAVRDRFSYYPRDVWLYLLVAGWWRVHPELNLVGRAGSVGDELGSALIGSRLVTDLMQLCFLMERQYAPYPKWFGTAFSRLACGPTLTPILSDVVKADTWQTREAALMTAYDELATMHNALQLTAPVTTETEQLWGRPFKVVWADFPGLLKNQIQDPTVQQIADQWPFGPIDRFRDLLWPRDTRPRLLRLFD
jgi:hypothetical protein